MFDIKKCGNSLRNICKPPRLPTEVFSKLYHLPDPAIGVDVPFEQVFGALATEKDQPSSQRPKDGGKRYALKHVTNTDSV